MSRESRRFYHDRYARLVIRALLVLAAVIGVGIAAAPKLAVVLRLVVLILTIGFVLPGWMRWSAQGVSVGTDGMWITGLLGRRYVGWEQVDGFELVRFIAYSEVRVKLKSGDLVRTGLVQGRRMYWQGGSSANMLGVLNEDLARATVIRNPA